MGCILMIEFDDRDTAVFDEIMRTLEEHPSFEQLRLRDESTLSLPALDIFLQRRKAYSGYTEIPLTAKEFNILCMLAANKGIVLTYNQIYHRLWKEDSAGNVSNTVGCKSPPTEIHFVVLISTAILHGRAVFFYSTESLIFFLCPIKK